jgi:exosortase E/protease (VPEID-CTERM system)
MKKSDFDINANLVERQTLRWKFRWGLSAVALVLGVVWSGPASMPGTWWNWSNLSIAPPLPLPSGFELVAVLVSAATATALFGWTIFRDEVLRTVRKPDAHKIGWAFWLFAYALVVSLPQIWARTQSETGELYFLAKGLLTLAGIACWCLAAMPLSFWLRFSHRAAKTIVIGGTVGGVIYLAGHHYALRSAAILALQRPTLWTTYFLLCLTGKHATLDAANYVITTPGFSVVVGSACSGLEGIALSLIFFAIYLWVYQREFRFPQVFLLFPLGAAALWLFNAVRIFLLILLGSWSSDLAMNGFHSVAGWLFFDAVTAILVLASRRSSIFAKSQATAATASCSYPVAPYLMPLVAMIVVAMVAQIVFPGFQTLYPLRVIAGAGTIWFYGRSTPFPHWSVSWTAVVFGTLAFVTWVVLQPGGDVVVMDASFRAAMMRLPTLIAVGWLLFRVVGAVFLVPIAEELAFRGYLLRRLISADFELVSSRRFTWLSFLGSSVIFGMMHSQWLAATVAGMIFALSMYRRGLLFDAVVSHAIANGLLSAYIMISGHWSLWN